MEASIQWLSMSGYRVWIRAPVSKSGVGPEDPVLADTLRSRAEWCDHCSERDDVSGKCDGSLRSSRERSRWWSLPKSHVSRSLTLESCDGSFGPDADETRLDTGVGVGPVPGPLWALRRLTIHIRRGRLSPCVF